MIVGGIYSFNNGREVIEANYVRELADIMDVIKSVDAGTTKRRLARKKRYQAGYYFGPAD